MTGTYLERLGRADGRDGHGPVPGPRPGPGRAARRVLARPRGRRAVRHAGRRGGRPARRRGQAEPRVLRGVRVGRDGRPRADPRAASRPTCRSSPTPSAATSARRPRARPSPCSTVSGADAVTVNPYLGEEAIAPLSSGPTASPTSCAGPRTPGRGSSRTSWSPRTADAGRPGRAAPRAGRPPGGDLGTRRHGRPRRRRRPPRPSSPPSGRSRPGSRSWCPASAPRAARSSRSSSTAPRRAAPAGGRPGGGLLVNVSRGIAEPRRRPPATAVRPIRWSGSRQPPPSGPNGSLCYPSPRTGRSQRLVPTRRGAHSIRPSQEHDDAEHRTPELIIILVIALLVLGPGKLPDVGAALGKSIKEFRKAATDVQEAHEPRTRPRRRTGRAPAAPAAAVEAAPAAARRRRRRGRGARRRARRRSRPRPPPASRRPRATDAPRPGLRSMADADALRDAGVPAIPVTPGSDAAPGRRPADRARRLGDDARRPPRRAAHRLFRSILAVAVGSTIGFYFSTQIRDS